MDGRRPRPIDASEDGVAPRLRLAYASIAAAVVMLIAYGSWVPFRPEPLGREATWGQVRQLLAQPWFASGGRVDWAVNCLITVPLGFFLLAALLAGRRKWPAACWSVPLVVGVSMGLSLTVEIGQIWLPGRIASMQDVSAQTLGTLAGISLYLLVGRHFDRWATQLVRRRGPDHPLDWALQAYVVGLAGYSILPLDVVMSPSELVEKYEAGRFEWVPFSLAYPSPWHAAYGYFAQWVSFVPVGAWAAIAWRPRGGRPRGLGDSLLLGAGAVVGIEILQALIISRYTSSTDVILGSLGVAVGTLLVRRLLVPAGGVDEAGSTQRSRGWLLAAAGYAALLPIVFWAPYDFTDDRGVIKQRLSDMRAVPFARMQQGSDLVSLFAASRAAIWFAPVGLLAGVGLGRLALRAPGRHLVLVLVAAGISGWALLIELVQVLLPSRHADLTDALICSAGGLAGLFLATRVGGAGKRNR